MVETSGYFPGFKKYFVKNGIWIIPAQAENKTEVFILNNSLNSENLLKI